MPKIVRRNMFHDDLDLYVITTNGAITKDSKLVMGRGAALEAKQLAPGLDRTAVAVTQFVFDRIHDCRVYGFADAGFAKCTDGKIRRFGLFQVKYHWRDDADFALIGFSIIALNKWLNDATGFSVKKVGLNYPGVGNGNLVESAVKPLLTSLDPRVVIYRL